MSTKFYEDYKKIIIVISPNKDYGFDWVIEEVGVSGWSESLDDAKAQAKEAINKEG